MNAYCLNIGDTYTVDYTLTANDGAINDIDILITPSVALSLVGATSTSNTGTLVGNTFSIPTIAANTTEVVTVTVAIVDNVSEDLTVEIKATTTTVQSTVLDDTKTKDLEDYYVFHRRCLENTLARYRVPNEAFADIYNPTDEEVRTWVDANLIAAQKVHAELYSIEIENDLELVGSYLFPSFSSSWQFGGASNNIITGISINGTVYPTSIPWSDGSANVVGDIPTIETFINDSLTTEGLVGINIDEIDPGDPEFLNIILEVDDPTVDIGTLTIHLIGDTGNIDYEETAEYTFDPVFTISGSDNNNPDHIWSIVNDEIQTVFHRQNIADTFYLDSSIGEYREGLAQKGNPQRPFKNQNDVLNRADFNVGDTIVFLKADGTDFTTTKDVVVTAPISVDVSKLFYVQDNHELTLKSDSDFGVFAWGFRADGDNVKINANLNKVDSSIFNIGPGVDADINIRFNDCIITDTGFGNGVFYIGNGPTPPPTAHTGRSNILIEGDHVSTVNMGSLTEREDTDFTYKVKKLTNSGPTIGGFGALQLYRSARRCNYTIRVDEFILDNYNFTSLAAFSLSTGSSGDTFTLIDSNLTFDFGRVSMNTTSSFALTDYRTSMINAQASGWNIQNSTITIKIDQLEKSDINILGLSGATFTNSTLILDVNGKSEGALALFNTCTFTNSRVIIRGDFETTGPAVVSFTGASSPILVVENARLKATDAPIVAPGDIEIYKTRLINTALGTTVNRNAAGASNILAEGVVANGAADGNYSVLGSPFIINAAVS